MDTVTVYSLKCVRDTAQSEYAESRIRLAGGLTTQRQHDAKRSAYMIAQSEYSAALKRARATDNNDMEPQP